MYQLLRISHHDEYHFWILWGLGSGAACLASAVGLGLAFAPPTLDSLTQFALSSGEGLRGLGVVLFFMAGFS